MRIRKYGIHSFNTHEDNRLGGGIHPYHHELLYISSGKVQFQCPGITYCTEAPALFLLIPNIPHQLLRLSSQCSFLFMELDILQHDDFPDREQALTWNELQNKPEPDIPTIRTIYHMMDQLRSLLHSELSDQFDLLEEVAVLDIKKMIALIRHVIRTANPRKETGKSLFTNCEQASSAEIVEHIMRYLECSYQHNITLQTLCNEVFITPSYLIRLFKEHKGMTPFQYLNELRMNAAVSYLTNNNMSIQKIVEATGYQSIHYFSRLFKQKYGLSPSRWRTTSQK